MPRTLGLLACTSVAAVGLWSLLPDGTTRPLSADQPGSADRSRDAVITTEPRGSILNRVNPFSRSSSKSSSTGKASPYKQTALKLLDDAQALAAKGDYAGARRLAERAKSFPIDWGNSERSPDRMLAELDARMNGRPNPNSTIAARPKPTPNAIDRTESQGNTIANFEKPNKQPSRGEIRPAAAVVAEELDDPAPEAIQPQPKTIRTLTPAAPAIAAARTLTDEEAAEKRARVKALLQQARREIAAGNLAAARDKAEQARKLDVAFNLFDERPEQMLAELDRRENNAFESAPATEQIAQTPPPAPGVELLPPEELTDDSALPAMPAKRVRTLPDFDDSPFDDEPRKVATVASAEIPAVNTDKQLAEQLLQRSQAAIKAGDLDTARELALQAKDLEVTYSLFDLQPQHVIAQIDRASNNLTIAKGGVRNKPAAKPQSAPRGAELRSPFDPIEPDSPLTEPAPAKTNVAASKQPPAGLFPEDIEPRKPAPSVAATTPKPSKDTVPAATAAPKELPEFEVTADEPTTLPPAAASRFSAADDSEQQKLTTAEKKATEQVRQQAVAALQQARKAMQAGQLETARQKALTAQKLNATFGLWDDRPEAMLAEIDRLADAQQIPAPKNIAPTEFKTRAMALLKEARADLAAGRLESAREKSERAAKLNVAFDVWDDRPELVFSAIQRAQRNIVSVPPAPPATDDEPLLPPKRSAAVAQSTPSVQPRVLKPMTDSGSEEHRPDISPAPPADDSIPEPGDEPQVAVVHPEGPSAEQLFREGQIHLSSGNKAAAYQAFLRAYQSGQKLDARRGQQLQDYLRELNPRRTRPIQLASNEGRLLAPLEPSDASANPAAQGASEPRPLDPQRAIDIASDRQKVQLDRLRNETLNAIFRAERLREKEPVQALEILDQTLANIEGAPLDKQLTAPLATSLKKSRVSIEGFQKQMEPNLALSKRNQEVKEEIARDQKRRVRVEQEFATLVKQFNELMDQKRYAEAGAIAKQAKDLDGDNPVAENMVFKSLFALRVANNDKIKNAKEDGFIGQLISVDESSIPFDDRNPIRFPKDWNDMVKGRGKYGSDGRARTPEEQKIETSLGRQVTLHFDNAPLKQVIEHIATHADINIILDKAGLEEESLSVSSPVSINVDSITLKSALMLVLEPLDLGYTVKHEVLQITNTRRLQGELAPVTYSVADLVVPIQANAPTPSFASGNPLGASVGGQLSVPSAGGLQGGQFQVGSAALGAPAAPWMSGNSPQWQPNGQRPGSDFRELIELITTTCEPGSWTEMGGAGEIKGHESTLSLVIRQTQKVHDEIRDLLEQLRRLQDLQVTIEVRFVTVADNFFERIGIDFDFDIQDSIGGPNVFSGGGQQGQAGGGGGGGQQAQQGGLIPLPPFGSILSGGQQQQGQQQGQQGQRGQQGGSQAQFFTPGPNREFSDRDRYGTPKVVGLGAPESFTDDLDIAFRQGSFAIGIPDFGRFDANAGMSIGFAILSDIETFFFINAAQGDRRSNIMSAPKVTLFNGQTASVSDFTSRPFVQTLIPVVGAFSVGYQPIIGQAQDGIFMSVTAVISADRRYVRLNVLPFFNVVREFTSFTFVSSAGGGGAAGQGGQGGGGQGGGGQGGFGGGGQGGGGGGGQLGFGGIGGGPVMERTGIHNDGVFGRSLSASDAVADSAQLGFGGIGGFGGGQGGGGFGGGGGGFGGGGGGQGGGGGGNLNAAGAGDVSVQQPIIATTNVSTSVSVPDGGTVLLGGVKRLSESRNMAGVPILNKIPYISRLFRNTGVGRETSSLMMMVTPRIVILEEEEALLGIPN